MSLIHNQCFFCGDEGNLIHMDTNSLIINSIYIDFSQLVLELLQIKIDDDKGSNMICIPCKDQLSQFYILKQQALKHLKPADIRKQQIVETVVGFLDQTVPDCIVSKFSNLLAIHTESNSPLVMEQLENCNLMLTTEENQVNLDDECVSYSFIEEEPLKSEYQETDAFVGEDLKIEGCTPEVICLEPQAKVIASVVKTPTKKKYKQADLSLRVKEWMKKEISQSAFLFETSFGNKVQYSCSKCSFKSFASENSFRVHLKTHLDNEQEQEILEGGEQVVIKEISSEEQSIIEQKLWISHQLASQKELIATKDGIKAQWTCSLCKFSSLNRGRFRCHLQKIHSNIVWRGPSKYSCYECHLRFDGENHLEVHKNCHRIFEVLAPYAQYPECECCKMFFATISDLEFHHERHNNSPDALRQPILAEGVVHRNGETFSNEDEDRLEIHDADAPTCGHCLVKFASEVDCKNHLMLFHVSTFTCPFDSRVFDGIPTLSLGNHLRQCHPDIFPELEISCKLCKMQFETVYEKLAHMKKCDSKLFQCDHCDKTFGKKTDLLHHLKVAIGLMVFACNFCGKRCKDQGDLKTHIRSHTNDRPYPCPHCEKAYKTSSARASHVESHMEQTHVCGICNVKFRRRILYQRHMKTLHDEDYRQKCFAENTCRFCKKSYLRKTHYKNHMKTHNFE